MIKFKPADIIITFISIFAAVGSGFFIYGSYTAPVLLEITSWDNTSVYNLENDRVISIEGPLGDSTIHINNHEAYFENSPCPDKLCVKSGHLKSSGDWTGCLPNLIFIRIIGEDELDEEVDTISY